MKHAIYIIKLYICKSITHVRTFKLVLLVSYLVEIILIENSFPLLFSNERRRIHRPTIANDKDVLIHKFCNLEERTLNLHHRLEQLFLKSHSLLFSQF